LGASDEAEAPLRMTQKKEVNPVILYENKDNGDLREKKNLLKIK
jgi:hypothetical protein